MICPKCDTGMEAVLVEDIEVDRCTHCQGLFFDMLETDDVRDLRTATSVDSGSAEVGKGRNIHIDIRCPVDGARMVHMVDPAHRLR